jgi:hypothetical protein
MNGTVVNYSVEGAKYGISFGTALAIAISYTNNHSVLWAIIHGLFSWLYVIYYLLFKYAARRRRADLTERATGRSRADSRLKPRMDSYVPQAAF